MGKKSFLKCKSKVKGKKFVDRRRYGRQKILTPVNTILNGRIRTRNRGQW